MKSYSQKAEEAQNHWKVVDADGQVLGRLASQVATLIRGKHKATFTPHVDGGDFVVVINAEKIRLTGNKPTQKMYHYHSGYVGGIKSYSANEMLQSDPEEMIQKAVWGMLPKGALGRQMIKKLKVYRGPSHPHQAQNPEAFELR